MNIFGLAVTFIVGLSTLIGTMIVFISKKNNNFISFSISMAFGAMILLLIQELLPEAYQLLKTNQFRYLLLIISVALGMIVLKIIDMLVPNHDHHHGKKDGEKHNLHHSGIVSSIVLVLHNLIEGMALYGASIESIKLGVLVGIGVGLHNIPIGMIIASTFLEAGNNKKKTFFISTGLALSTFVGGLLLFIFNNKLMDSTILGILIAITAGMLIYISLFELLPQMFCEKNKKINIFGIITGMSIFLISQLF